MSRPVPYAAGEKVAPLAPLAGRVERTEDPGPDRNPLATSHLTADIERRAVRSGFVTVSAQAAKFGLNLAGAVILARLIPPTDFGLVAMVAVVTAFLSLLKDAGLSTATIQRETISHGQVSNLFWLNVALGAVLMGLALAIAPAVAAFYREPRLLGIMGALSVTFLLNGLVVQHQALLVRQMRFSTIAVVDIASLVCGLTLATVLARAGFGYWALVALQLGVAGFGLFLTWWASGWRPSWPGRQSGVGPLVRFGAHMTGSGIFARVAGDSDSLLIGRFWGAEQLGLYSRASALLARPLEQLLTPVSSVLIPTLSRLQTDPVRYRRTFLKAYDLIGLVTFPCTALLLGLAEPVILILLGEAWRGAAPIFAGFALSALYLPLGYAATWLFTSQGRGSDSLKAQALLSIFTIAAFAAGLPWGPVGVVIAGSTTGLLIRLPILYVLAGQRGPVSTRELFSGFFAFLPCWLGVYGATNATSTLLVMSPLVQLVVCGTVGSAVGLLILLVTPRTRAALAQACRLVRSTGTL